jgi:hypothetical protein
MGNTSEEKKDISVSSRRYGLNLLLFLVLTISSMIWFYRHLYLYVTHSLVIGGSLTIWGILKASQSVYKWSTGKDTELPSRSILGRASSTEFLTVALIALVVLFFTTSSIYLEYNGGTKDESEFDVEVLHNGKPFLDKIHLKSYERISGMPFFFRLSSRRLRFRISNPIGYQDKVEDLRPWTSLRLSVPFERKEFHILRLIPGKRVYVSLPEKDYADVAEQPYKLRITREGSGSEIEIDNILQESIYIGASDSEIRWAIGREPVETRRKVIFGYFFLHDLDKEKIEEIFGILESSMRIEPTPGFKAKERIRTHVIQSRTNRLISSDEHEISSSGGIQTIFLEGETE